MVCIYCAGQTLVVNSRKTVRSHTTWRRRRCKACGAVVTSFEAIDLAQSIVVRSDPNDITPLSRDELFISIYESCRHRTSAVTDATALTQTVLEQLLRRLPRQMPRGTLNKQIIQTTAHAILQRFDSSAATHYKAYFMRESR